MIDKNIGEHQCQSQHYRDIENSDKILIGIQPKNTIFDIEGKLIATKEIAECNEIECQEDIVDVEIGEAWHLWHFVILIEVVTGNRA